MLVDFGQLQGVADCGLVIIIFFKALFAIMTGVSVPAIPNTKHNIATQYVQPNNQSTTK